MKPEAGRETEAPRAGPKRARARAHAHTKSQPRPSKGQREAHTRNGRALREPPNNPTRARPPGGEGRPPPPRGPAQNPDLAAPRKSRLKAGGKPSTWFPPGGTRRAGCLSDFWIPKFYQNETANLKKTLRHHKMRNDDQTKLKPSRTKHVLSSGALSTTRTSEHSAKQKTCCPAKSQTSAPS